MRTQSTFFRISSLFVVFALVTVAALADTRAQASTSAQATATQPAMMSSTMMATMMDDSIAFPPCPANEMSPTMAATMSGTPAMMSGTPAMMATMNSMMSGTPAMMATMYVMPGAAMAGCTLSATLVGTNEVPKAGDPKGTGKATLQLSRPANGPGEVCFDIEVSGIKLPAAAAHIHAGAEGVAGPVIVPFVGPDASGKAVGCTENVDRTLIASILTNPANYYVNVHNSDFPGGAMRGQLSAVTK